MLNRAPGRVGGDLSGMDVGGPWTPGCLGDAGRVGWAQDHYQLVTCTILAGLSAAICQSRERLPPIRQPSPLGLASPTPRTGL